MQFKVLDPGFRVYRLFSDHGIRVWGLKMNSSVGSAPGSSGAGHRERAGRMIGVWDSGFGA